MRNPRKGYEGGQFKSALGISTKTDSVRAAQIAAPARSNGDAREP
jgi:hypothetical protein